MKKIFYTLISLILVFQLCACKPLDTLYSAFDEILSETAANSTVIIIDERVETYRVNPKTIDDNELAFLFAYLQLDNEQKKLYRIIYTAVEEMKTGWIELGACRDSFSHDISIAYQALSTDHPELFWMPYTYLISTRKSGGKTNVYIALSHSNNDHSCDYLVNKQQRDEMNKQLEARVSLITAAVSGK